MNYAALKKDLEHKMIVSLDHAKKEFSGLRTGRASTALLDSVVVDAYGAKMPLNQVGSVSVPEPRLLSVSVWDKGLAKSVEKAIREANLGLNPMTDGRPTSSAPFTSKWTRRNSCCPWSRNGPATARRPNRSWCAATATKP